jgi:predicted RNA-binding Zn-ribbon protein involved in translation (DUF1610 family)
VVLTNRFVDAVKHLKYTGHPTLACPSCGSLRIKYIGSLSGWLTPAAYACGECGYNGSLIIEVDEAELEKSNRTV